ncbi:MAG: ATP-binding protein [Planctomycetota bacterium]
MSETSFPERGRTKALRPRLASQLEPLARGVTGGAFLSIAALAIRLLWAPTDPSLAIYLVGMMGACAGLGLSGWWLSKRLSRRGPAIAAIEEALDAHALGERETQALRLDDSLGPRARSWNALLDLFDSNDTTRSCRRAERAASAKSHDAEELSACFESISQGILILDRRLAVTRSNGAARVLLGLGEEDVTARSLADLIEETSIISAAREVVAGERRPDSIELDRQDDGEDGIVRVSFRPLRRGVIVAALVIIDDITQRRLAEKARDGFVAHATHELRTPLTNIRLHVEEALDSEDTLLRSRALQSINHESRRLERTIADMLSVSEIEAGTLSLRPAEVRLESVFKEMEAEFAPHAREQEIDLRFDLPPKYPVARADRDKLVLAIHNLIGNALKYTRAGGRVDVTVRADERDFEVRVADTGIGIAESDLTQIFDRFYRADDDRIEHVTGSGLGLALAREIARLHGGDIEVESQMDKGSVFTLTACIARAESAIAA